MRRDVKKKTPPPTGGRDCVWAVVVRVDTDELARGVSYRDTLKRV